MIICLEGPSAVGKTTTCSAIAEQMGAYIVPEVNAIFERPADASPNWYLECQVARWEIAQRQQEQHGFAVLDGDLFQPLWYNWA
jgi:broad-specificity NMP kinase